MADNLSPPARLARIVFRLACPELGQVFRGTAGAVGGMGEQVGGCAEAPRRECPDHGGAERGGTMEKNAGAPGHRLY